MRRIMQARQRPHLASKLLSADSGNPNEKPHLLYRWGSTETNGALSLSFPRTETQALRQTSEELETLLIISGDAEWFQHQHEHAKTKPHMAHDSWQMPLYIIEDCADPELLGCKPMPTRNAVASSRDIEALSGKSDSVFLQATDGGEA